MGVQMLVELALAAARGHYLTSQSHSLEKHVVTFTKANVKLTKQGATMMAKLNPPSIVITQQYFDGFEDMRSRAALAHPNLDFSNLRLMMMKGSLAWMGEGRKKIKLMMWLPLRKTHPFPAL
ncbi:hypothetical protein RHMOL_Rhmol07G0187400 [Rhododendron molle]|uniref:Uncharacterized protein n=1 Tax=Rhododendron molle TaxID=49168 RepID=A0ACC0N2W3_RHOML|nr:hypothetical protein RHMOL_Rhmol07G0187400 [Rhododendron molle]